jgi:ADP-ribosylglycohydrolase
MEYVPDFERELGITQEPWGLAVHEVGRAGESGREVTDLRERLAAVSPEDETELLSIYEEALARPEPEDWPHFEGSGLAEIMARLPEAGTVSPEVFGLPSKLRGAWFGRVAGNMLGKAVEGGPSRATLASFLERTGAYPLTDYVAADPSADKEIIGIWGAEGMLRGAIDGSVRDDDIDYTILGLHILEEYGPRYTSLNVATEWLNRFPIYQTFTAERAAYTNLVREVRFEDVGEYRNPFREWIGALIRADIFGFVSPGDPRGAALLSYNDAALSHRGNGILGEMWAAALIASAFAAETPEESIVESLRHIPPTSRLACEVQSVLEDWRAGLTWAETVEKIDARYPEMTFVGTLNNAGALSAAVLWGDGDYAATAGLAVMACLDTDSIGATAGAWAGAFLGYEAIPARFIDPLRDHVRSAVFGFGDTSISNLVDRTSRVIDSLKSQTSSE